MNPFSDEHGVTVHDKSDDEIVFSVDGLAFREIEARHRIRSEGYEIVETDVVASGDHYDFVAKKP